MPFIPRLVRPALAAALLLTLELPASAQSAPDEPFELSELQKSGKPPKPIRQGQPAYPRQMSRGGISGAVRVNFIIDTKGNVRDAIAVKSTRGEFEQPAVAAVMGWKFQPGEMNGRPVKTRATQLIEFKLNPGGRPPDRERSPARKPAQEQPRGNAPEQPGELNAVRSSDQPPQPIKLEPPVYPPGMARAGLIGAVKVEFIIDQEGRVRNPYVVESNNPWFERPAVEAVMEWKFQPGKKDGHPVDTRVEQLIVFNMDTGGQTPELWQVSKGKEHDKLPPEFQWDTPPTPKSTLFPVYPFEQLETGVEGEARISYIVGPDGHVIESKLREATTPEFGRAAIAMIDAWRFDPAKKKDGTPAFANLGIEYRFRTNGRGEVPVSDEARWILSDLKKNPGKIAGLKELDQPLKPRSRRPPVYPTALAEAGQPGEAMIEFFVDRNGDAQLPRIISSTATEFGYAAVQAVATWRFEVPKKDGKPVVVRARIPVNFSVKPEDTPGQTP